MLKLMKLQLNSPTTAVSSVTAEEGTTVGDDMQ